MSRPGDETTMINSPEEGTALRRDPRVWAAIIFLIIAGVLAYANSLSGPFVYDDEGTLVTNESIRQLWPLSVPLHPPGGGVTTSGRPFANLSFALNYALGGTAVEGYHVTNVLIHILAALAFFGVLRRSLLLPALKGRFKGAETTVALTCSALWLLHPLQTESVTYLAQRTESLMGLLYLATLYTFIRGAGHTSRRALWFSLSAGLCFLGMATKEVMVSAPLFVLLYDRLLISGSFAEVWRRHGRQHLALASSWLLLAWMVLGTGGNRGATIGFGVAVSWWRFELTQIAALTRYLQLAFWPKPLVFDYGMQWVTSPWSLLPQAALLIALLGAVAYGLWRRPILGLLGLFFFALLAPTSLLPGIRQTMAEHRLYLALAPVIILSVSATYLVLGVRGLSLFAFAALGLGVTTWQRNQDYRTEVALWTDTVNKLPTNAFAQANLGHTLDKAHKPEDAIAHYEASVRLAPESLDNQHNLGLVLLQSGQAVKALATWEKILVTVPGFAEAQCGAGNALLQLGRPQEAIPHFEAALNIRPAYADARFNLGNALAGLGRLREAAEHYEALLRLQPAHAGALTNLGNLHAQAGNYEEAIQYYQAALRVDPLQAEVHSNLGNLYLQTGHPLEARKEYVEALRIRPSFSDAQRNLAIAEQVIRDGG